MGVEVGLVGRTARQVKKLGGRADAHPQVRGRVIVGVGLGEVNIVVRNRGAVGLEPVPGRHGVGLELGGVPGVPGVVGPEEPGGVGEAHGQGRRREGVQVGVIPRRGRQVRRGPCVVGPVEHPHNPVHRPVVRVRNVGDLHPLDPVQFPLHLVQHIGHAIARLRDVRGVPEPTGIPFVRVHQVPEGSQGEGHVLAVVPGVVPAAVNVPGEPQIASIIEVGRQVLVRPHMAGVRVVPGTAVDRVNGGAATLVIEHSGGGQ